MTTFASPSMAKPAKTASPVKRQTELSALTGLRFFAAVYVVFYHFSSTSIPKSLPALVNIFSLGYIAVGLFFLLSGFVLSYSYLRQPSASSPAQVSVDKRSFWVARIARIYPAYLLAFLLAAPFHIAGSIGVNGVRLGLQKLAFGGSLVLTLLQAWTPWTAWYWNIPAWSLSVEVFFYLCFPFVAPLVGRVRPKSSLWLIAALWLAGLAVPIAYCLLYPADLHVSLQRAQIAIETNPILRLPEFLAGISLGWIFVSGFRFSRRVASLLSIAALAVLLTIAAFSSFVPRPLFTNGLLVPVLGLLIFTLAHQSGILAKFLSHPILKLLGDASYAIYVLQFPVASLLRVTPGNCTFAKFFLYIVVLIFSSILTFFFVEQPMRSHIKTWLGRRDSSARKESTAPVVAQMSPEQIPAKAY
jgi:peptidoglycan/LPS O-acetylase OafA/YrhL